MCKFTGSSICTKVAARERDKAAAYQGFIENASTITLVVRAPWSFQVPTYSE